MMMRHSPRFIYGRGFNYSGGENTIVNYTSNINENWTLSFLYGRNEANRTFKVVLMVVPQYMREELQSLEEKLLKKVAGLTGQLELVLMKEKSEKQLLR